MLDWSYSNFPTGILNFFIRESSQGILATGVISKSMKREDHSIPLGLISGLTKCIEETNFTVSVEAYHKVFIIVFLQILMTVIPGMTYFPKKGKVLGRSLVIVDNMAPVLMVSTCILVCVTRGGMEPSVKLVYHEC